MYRTGDLVRLDAPTGRWSSSAASDEQVKIRGFRIEPGEVEAVLAERPGGGGARRRRPRGRAGTQRLVAYVLGAGDGGDGTGRPDPAALRTRAAERLPEHMVPGRGRRPRRAAGDAERQGGRAGAAGARRGGDGRRRAARTPREGLLAGLVAEVARRRGGRRRRRLLRARRRQHRRDAAGQPRPPRGPRADHPPGLHPPHGQRAGDRCRRGDRPGWPRARGAVAGRADRRRRRGPRGRRGPATPTSCR